MPKTIYDIGLLNLIPPNMAGEAQTQAVCAAFDAMSEMAVQAIQKVYVLANIQQQSDGTIDMLSLQQHVDYYNQALPIETRRNLVANSGYIHKIKGTPAAVEQVARIVFGSARVQEWFEYGGNPYCFRVLINEFPNSDKQLDEVNRAIASAQNIRSHLDEVIIIASTATATGYLAGVVQMSVDFTVIQKA